MANLSLSKFNQLIEKYEGYLETIVKELNQADSHVVNMINALSGTTQSSLVDGYTTVQKNNAEINKIFANFKLAFVMQTKHIRDEVKAADVKFDQSLEQRKTEMEAAMSELESLVK